MIHNQNLEKSQASGGKPTPQTKPGFVGFGLRVWLMNLGSCGAQGNQTRKPNQQIEYRLSSQPLMH